MLERVIRKFLYWPEPVAREKPLPGYVGNAEEIWFRTSLGNEIHSLHWPAPPKRPTILFFHGNAQTVFEWALIRGELEPMRCGLLLVDYPGYGKSEGSPSEESLYSCGQAAFDWLTVTMGIAGNQIVIFGKSLGGGVACEVAQNKNILGLVLESTFRSIPSVAKKLLPMLPTAYMFKVERYESINKLKNIHAPLLVLHGDRDDLIPYEEGLALYEAANEPKAMYVIKGAGHSDVALTAGEDYGIRLHKWLDSIY